jgi:uncharacterized protein (DUF1499 family)
MLGIAILAGLIVLVLVAGQLGLLKGPAPKRNTSETGKLRLPKLGFQNSVSSQFSPTKESEQRHFIEPLKFTGDPIKAMVRLKPVILTIPDLTIIEHQPHYLYAQAHSKLLKFVDDLEFIVDAPNSVIHVRSAARLGYRDFDANRKRIEAIRQAWDKSR